MGKMCVNGGKTNKPRDRHPVIAESDARHSRHGTYPESPRLPHWFAKPGMTNGSDRALSPKDFWVRPSLSPRLALYLGNP